MRTRHFTTLTLLMAASIACRTTPQPASVVAMEAPQTTSVLGRWVLAAPLDSTAFAGAQQVELMLAPQSFSVTVAYVDRAPLTVTGTHALTDDGMLTLTPTTNTSEARAIGFAAGQPLTRVAKASGASLILAPPTAKVAVPSSVWYRLEAARLAGIAR